MTTHEVLVKARNLIEREGWRQGDYGGPQIGYCTLGACGEHKAYRDRERFAVNGAMDALGAAIGISSFKIAHWNDEPGRTKAEVLAAFDKAIAATAPEPADPFDREPEPAPEPIAA